MSIDLAYQLLTGFVLLVLTVLALASLIRCIVGPRISDRIMAINITGTLTVIMVCATVVLLSEGCLADIALVYSMISFLAVVVLSKVYTGIYYERKHEESLHAAEETEETACKEVCEEICEEAENEPAEAAQKANMNENAETAESAEGAEEEAQA